MKGSNIPILLLFFPVVAIWLVVICPGTSPSSDLSLRYAVEATPGHGLRVELRVTGLSGKRPGFRLLDGWGVLQNQSRHIEELAAFDSSGSPVPLTREMEEGEIVWRLRHRPEGEIVLRYRVRSYDPYLSPEATFVDRERMVMLGYSVFLLPQQAPHFRPMPIEVGITVAEGWPLWASWPGGEGAYRPPSAHDLWSGVVAGGEFHPSELGNRTVSLTVLTEARAQGITGLAIANRLLPVLREMHRMFGAAPRGDDLRVLAVFRTLPGRGNLSVMTGNSEEGAFLCLATPDRYRNADALTALAAHECLHFYLGGAISADPEPPYRNAPDLIWLMEGMTEYLTYRIMEEAGVLPPEQAVSVAARKEAEYRDNQRGRGLTLAEAARSMEDVGIYSLVYSRGYLVAGLLDRELGRRCGVGTLDAVLRDLFERDNFYRNQKPVDAEGVRARFEQACPGMGAWIARYAEGNAELPMFVAGHETAAAVETGKSSP